MDLISLVVPCYNEEAAVTAFYDTVVCVAEKMKNRCGFEFIFVNDGSKDKTIDIVKSLAEKDDRVRYISFSRNFGKESAMYAGLEKAKGNYVCVIDVDLQDPPELLEEMYDCVSSGEYDCAATRRVNRKGEPPIRSVFARLFYKLINRISDADIVDGARDFRLMTRQMTDAVLSLKEYNRFSKGIFGWVGFNTRWIEFENRERTAGETKWSFFKLLKYSFEGIVAFSTMPLAIASVIGIVMCVIALIIACVIFVKTLIFGDPVAGYPSMMCIICFLSGIQLFTVGILGQYLSKTYSEVKKRPIYIIKEEN